MNRLKVTVLGAGSWGTALAVLFNRTGHDVTLWGRMEDGINVIALERINQKYLPGVEIATSISVTDQLDEALDSCQVVVLAVPSQAVRQVLKRIAGKMSDTIVVNTAKGFEINSDLRLSQVFKQEMGVDRMAKYVVLSGPSHAEEVGRGLPTAVVVASQSRESAVLIQDMLMSRTFRVYTSSDITAVEVGGALKNVVALATGICEGLGFGDNTKAALLTRGLAEITRMGLRLGGNANTFAGLSGLGDLVVTCNSLHSRNRRAGILIGQGKSREEAERTVGMVVEGISTTQAAYSLARKLEVQMPITEMVYGILFAEYPVEAAVWQLMERDKREEY